MRIAILGAGGVGGVYGGGLARAGHHVALLARGENLEALRAHGLTVKTPEGPFTAPVEATDDAARLGGADLALVTVKCYSLADVVPAARLLAEGGATVLPLLNGVEAAERLVRAGVPGKSLLGGLTHVSAARVAPGVFERKSPFQRVTVGELSGGVSDRAAKVAAAFREAGAEAGASADIVAELWKKLAFIATMVASCGLARSPIGAVRRAPYGPVLLERAVREAFAVGRARGVALPDEEISATLRFISSLPDAMKPSFLLDLEAGGPTELDDLCGALSRLGREAGIATPVHDTATAALSAALAGEKQGG